MNNFKKYDFFIFDCDGVILNSNALKTDAFKKVLKNESELNIKNFIAYHKKNGGISRYEKFHYFYSNIIESKNSIDQNVKKALDHYGDIVYRNLLKCDFIPGVMVFIKNLYEKNKNIFIVSGSDQKELITVFRERGISKYFKKIYGSPNHKKINTGLVVNTFNKKEKGVFFGDSRLDFKSAVKYNLDFFFISGVSEWESGHVYVKKNFIKKSFKDIV